MCCARSRPQALPVEGGEGKWREVEGGAEVLGGVEWNFFLKTDKF